MQELPSEDDTRESMRNLYAHLRYIKFVMMKMMMVMEVMMVMMVNVQNIHISSPNLLSTFLILLFPLGG